jgi:hypothetical protein
MPKSTSRRRSSPLEILIHLLMAPASTGFFSWQLDNRQLRALAEDLRWTVLRKIQPALDGRSIYRAMLQKHAISVDSLSPEFFMEILEVVREKQALNFKIADARHLSELILLEKYFVPVILEWAENERSVSVSRESTPSIEDLITHEDSSGNTYQRFPDEFSWVVNRFSPGQDQEPKREIPDDMKAFVRRIAGELTNAMQKILDSGKLDKYIILMARLEDDVCTWEMTFDYLKSLGVSRYSNWKSLSVVANRAMKEFIRELPADIKATLHQDDTSIPREDRHDLIRMALGAALEINPLPSPRDLLSKSA